MLCYGVEILGEAHRKSGENHQELMKMCRMDTKKPDECDEKDTLNFIESNKQMGNLLMSANFQPIFFIKVGNGWQPRRFKQMQAYLNLIGWQAGKVFRTGIFLNLKVHNPTLKRKMNGIDSIRIVLDGHLLKHYLQYREFIQDQSNIDKGVGEKSNIKKLTRFPKYHERIKLAKKDPLKFKGFQKLNPTLRKEIKAQIGELEYKRMMNYRADRARKNEVKP